MSRKKCFEDFPEDFALDYQVPGLSACEITDFASLYDPQRFHLDEAEAAKTHFGGLVASGFQTQLHCFRPFCDQVLLESWSVGAPGIEATRWLRPWYPGEVMDVNVSLVSRRRSSKRNDRGYLGFELRAKVNGEAMTEMDWTVIVLTQEGVQQA